jgi:hypothetical protein
MKNIIVIITTIVCITLSSCDDFLEKVPLDSYSVATVFQTEQDIHFALNGLYRQIPGFQGSALVGSELIYTHWTDQAFDRNKAYRSSDLDFSPSKSVVNAEYGPRYTTIRDVNEFLARAPQAKVNFADKDLFDRYIAEARFVRAVHYARLNFLFGEVPLLTEPTEPDYFPKRATREKVFNFVNTELTEIADILPEKYDNQGDEVRITAGAALAIKARHNLNAIDWHPNISELYANAADAAGKVYNMDYSLDQGVNGFQKLFTRASANGACNGAILTVNYDRDFKSHPYQTVISPKGAFCGTKKNNTNFVGASSITVESFQMLVNGLDVHDPASAYDPANPWQGRDPRLDITILRAGEIIPIKGGNGVSDLYIFDAHPKVNPVDTLQDGTIIKGVKTDDVTKSGINKTGYNYQKYMDFDFITPGEGDIQYHFVRYAEVILMYAEAVLGKNGDIALAMSLVNEVRDRVGMPDVNTSYGGVSGTAQALDIILKERVFEFALEGPQRYFDIRRHRLGEQVFADKNVYGIPLGKNRKPDAKVNEGDLDSSKKVIAGTKNFDPSTYYKWSIPLKATDANPNLLEAPE